MLYKAIYTIIGNKMNFLALNIEMRKINVVTLLKAGVQKRVMMKQRLNARKR